MALQDHQTYSLVCIRLAFATAYRVLEWCMHMELTTKINITEQQNSKETLRQSSPQSGNTLNINYQ